MKKKTYDELKSYFEIILEFDAVDDYQCVLLKINQLVIAQNRVWFLVGSNNKLDWECLQVAQTKNNILGEISGDVNFMLSYDYSKMVSGLANLLHFMKVSMRLIQIMLKILTSVGNILIAK